MIKFLSSPLIRVRVILSVIVSVLSVIAVAAHAYLSTQGSLWNFGFAVALMLILSYINSRMWITLHEVYEIRRDLETVQQDQSHFRDN